MVDFDTIMVYVALVGCIGAILFIISIAWVFLCAYLNKRWVVRRLKPSVFPVISFTWNGRLDALRDKIIEVLRNQQSGPSLMISQKAGFHRPSIVVTVHGNKWKIKCGFIGILIRKNKTNVCLELRSGHPLKRPSKKICREVLSQLEKGIALINTGSFVVRLKR